MDDSHLTFGKIADEWARELADAKVPGRRERDEIFLTFLRGALAGEFDDKNVTLAQARRDVYSEKLKDKGSENVVHRFNVQPLPMPITGEWLAQAQMVPTPRPGVRRPDTGSDPWYLSEGLNLDDFEPLFVSCYIEPLTISHEHFGQWCDDHGHERPVFWFGKPNKAGRPSTKREIEKAYKALSAAGEVDYNAPQNAVYEKIRSKVGPGREGFGDEAIRRVIKPLFSGDKELRGTL